MKKIILTAALALTLFSYAQDKPEGVKEETEFTPSTTVSADYTITTSNEAFYGIRLESQREKKLRRASGFIGGYYGTATVSVDGENHIGSGYRLEKGWRFAKDGNEKFYVEGSTSYAHFKFSDANYSGVYDYLTLINPAVGYKFMIGKHLAIDPSIGCLWKLEIKGRGDVDNKSFDNFIGKFGVKIGYRF